METAEFGATARGGVNRVALTDEDRRVRDWLVSACKSLDCKVEVDEVGNVFARREGKDAAPPVISFGSHLDTQPSGGKFDGIVGVLSALEVLRTLNEVGYTTNAPLELIDWTAEEGTRFPPMVGSGVFTGVYHRDWAYAARDRDGHTFLEQLEGIGYKGSRSACGHKLGAYFELHIEQGPVLEGENKTIGVVIGARGQRWYDVLVTGQEGHAGSTPMGMRKDAMCTCARIMEGVTRIAFDHQPEGLSTIGHVEVRPNSRNVIPGTVFFTIDLRHSDETVLQQMDTELGSLVEKVAADSGSSVKLDTAWVVKPMEFDEGCVTVVRNAAELLEYSYMDIVSGPGHDALHVARTAPTAMIFIPCERGVSHNEAENTKPEHVTAGANVLLNAVLEYDKN
jgi:N-carbamoyl-L-amino-acid hydrolase